MSERFAQSNTMPCITSVTPTISKVMGISPPADSGSDCLHEVVRAAGRRGVEKVARCLIYAPDAVGRQMYQNYRSSFDGVLEHAPIIVPLCSVTPPVTPVCYSSMFTGAQPQVHGIQKKEKPVLTCDTIFDALIRSGKKIAIVAVKGSSIDLIFRKRQMRYFSEHDDQGVTHQTIEVIKSDNFDFIVAYHSEYDDILHEMTPFCSEAIEALKHHLHAFSEFSKSMDVYWQKYNRMIWFAPDHGAHLDPQSGKGIHGDNIPEDMQVQHYIGIKPGKNNIPGAN